MASYDLVTYANRDVALADEVFITHEGGKWRQPTNGSELAWHLPSQHTWHLILSQTFLLSLQLVATVVQHKTFLST